MRINFFGTAIGARVFVNGMMPMVAVPVMYLFVKETNAATPIKFVS
jgi:hypothetical protein